MTNLKLDALMDVRLAAERIRLGEFSQQLAKYTVVS